MTTTTQMQTRSAQLGEKLSISAMQQANHPGIAIAGLALASAIVVAFARSIGVDAKAEFLELFDLSCQALSDDDK